MINLRLRDDEDCDDDKIEFSLNNQNLCTEEEKSDRHRKYEKRDTDSEAEIASKEGQTVGELNP